MATFNGVTSASVALALAGVALALAGFAFALAGLALVAFALAVAGAVLAREVWVGVAVAFGVRGARGGRLVVALVPA